MPDSPSDLSTGNGKEHDVAADKAKQPQGSSDFEEAPQMKRVVGLWNSFAMGYADVGADIYVAVGLVVAIALQASPLAFLLAAITYVATGLSYAELASSYPIAGGAQYYSLKAFGNIHGFLAGWGLMLDYTIDIALFALVSISYLGSFLNLSIHNGVLTGLPWFAIASMIIIIALIALNLVGIKYSATFNLVFVVINLVTMVLIMTVGLPIIIANGSFQNWLISITKLGTVPSWSGFIYATSLAMVSYIGIESISQAAEETKYPKRVIPLATKFAIISIVILSVVLSLITVNLLAPANFQSDQNDAVVAVAQQLSPYLTPLFAFWVAFVGFAICYVSTNTGVIGVSRVTFSMARLKLFPSFLSKLSKRFLTPYITIIIFPTIAILVILLTLVLGENTAQQILTAVAQLYNFGALIAYMYVNLSLIVLRTKDPTPRAWRVPGSFHLSYNKKKYEIPIIPLIGFISCFLVWLIVVGLHELGRTLGAIWFVIGLTLFVIYRKKNGLPIFRSSSKKQSLSGTSAGKEDSN